MGVEVEVGVARVWGVAARAPCPSPLAAPHLILVAARARGGAPHLGPATLGCLGPQASRVLDGLGLHFPFSIVGRLGQVGCQSAMVRPAQ